MNILLVCERYWPEVGAAPTRLAGMAEGLRREGNHIDVLTGLPNYPQGRIFEGYRRRLWLTEERHGVTLFRYWLYATVSKGAVARALNMFSFAIMIWLFALRVKRIRAYDIVIIQTPTLVSAVSAMAMLGGLYGRRCVLNVSDIWPSTAVDMGALREGSRAHRFLAWCERYLYAHADAVIGQSQEILDHVATYACRPDCLFLYRNLRPALSGEGRPAGDGRQQTQMPLADTTVETSETSGRHSPMRIVFSGMLGHAQDVASIVRSIPFGTLGIELHILGGGAQLDEIRQYISSHPDCGVVAHGFVAKDEIPQRLAQCDASIVPLATRIRGAVPSKIYDLLPAGLPILFSGGGEGAAFISSRHVGYVSDPGDYAALQANLERLRDLSDADYARLRANCIATTRAELNFSKQMSECSALLRRLSSC